MNRISYLLAIPLLLLIVFPLSGSANNHPPPSDIVPCGLYQDAQKKTTDECTFDYLVTLAQKVIDFLIFKIASPLAAVMFAYAGFLYVTNAGNEGKVKEAHEIFLYVFWGFVVCLAAWLTVNMILTFFLGANSGFNFLK